MNFIENMKEKAKKINKTIVLPESMEKRNLEAAATILKEGIAKIVLIGNKEQIIKEAAGLDVSGAVFVDPENYSEMDRLIDLLVEIRKAKGMTKEEATKLLKSDPMYLAVMLVKDGIADGIVSGAVHSTADTMRPSLQILKTSPGTRLVSSFFIMVVPDCEFGANGVFAFGDCAIVQNPNPEELAAIALSTAESFKKLVGEEPVVAMLSHSTKGSATHKDIDKVIEAVQIAKALNPDVILDGEFQLDAAIVPKIGAQKAPGNGVAGKANVIIFPDLDAGNIGYKLVERLAKAEAFGPVCQGIAKPVNDLSRGCSAEDIVGVVAITALQAQ